MTDFLHIAYKPWEISLAHQRRKIIIIKLCWSRKMAFSVALSLNARCLKWTSKAVKKRKKLQSPIMSRRWIKIDNFPLTFIHEKTGQLASLCAVFTTPIWIYWMFRPSPFCLLFVTSPVCGGFFAITPNYDLDPFSLHPAFMPLYYVSGPHFLKNEIITAWFWNAFTQFLFTLISNENIRTE